MKRPAFQFYPADWRGNAKLRRCSPAARGAWMDVLCLLHDADEYGVLRWPLADIANAAGVPMKLLRELADKGVLKGDDKIAEAYTYAPTHAGKVGPAVTLVEAGAGPCWYCTRFVRDEWVRQRRGNTTRFDADNQPPKQAPKAEPMGGIGGRQGDGPSSASASAVSSGSTTSTPPPADAVGQFEGHAEPKPGTSPAAPFAIALNRAGFRCTPLNPDLVAYVGEGGTVEHLLQVAALPECAGKAAAYPIRIARREVTETAKPVVVSERRGPPVIAHNPGGVSPVLSQAELEARKADALALMQAQMRDLGHAA